jgi:hypothetical protein
MGEQSAPAASPSRQRLSGTTRRSNITPALRKWGFVGVAAVLTARELLIAGKDLHGVKDWVHLLVKLMDAS